ncbi:MAG: DNA-binding response regulator [Ignavibacteria bacterium]|nr:MAG: DNA-binding response regulator [Ignavibacteria bacterium]
MEDKIRLLVAEDQTIVRDGIIKLLEDTGNIVIVGEAEDGEALVDKYKKLNPDVVLSDIEMPRMTGFEALEKLLKEKFEPKFIFLSVYADEPYTYYAYHLGAKGMLNKSINKTELDFAIEKVANGGIYFLGKSDEQLQELVEKYSDQKNKIKASFSNLTDRELEILDLVADGLMNDQIAEKLFISRRTVEKHRTNIMEKKNLKSLSELISFAVKLKYLKI